MATLQKIRSKGTTLIIILGLALFAFIAEELVRALSSSRNASRQVIGEIYGESVTYQEFNDLVDEYENAWKLGNGGQNLTEAQSIQLRDQVWSELLRTRVIEHEAEALGLTVTDAELQNIINTGSNQLLRQTPFVNQQTGMFDVNMLKQFLTNYEEIQNNPEYPEAQKEMLVQYYKYWKLVEKQVRHDVLAQKYQTLLSSCLISNPVSAKAAFEARNNETKVLLASVPYTSIKDSEVEPTEEELKAKYEELTKQMPDMFDMQDEARDIKYILVPVTASDADRQALTAEMNEYKAALDSTDNIANVVRESRSSVSYSGLPVSKKSLPSDIAAQLDSINPGTTFGPSVNAATNTMSVIKYIAKVQQADSTEVTYIDVIADKADSVLTVLNSGEHIDSVAKRLDTQSQTQWITSAIIDSQSWPESLKSFFQGIFQSPAGAFKSYELPGGVRIAKVNERRNVIDKYDVAIIRRNIDFSDDTHNTIWNKFSSFLAANPTQADIEANALKAGYQVQTAQYVSSADHYIANVPSTTDALRWVYKSKVGDVSELFEAGEAHDQFLVVMLTAIHKRGLRDFNDETLRQYLTQEVLKDKKAAQLLPKVEGAKSLAEVAKISGALQDTISHITFAAPVFVASTASSEPILSGAASAAAKGQFVTGLKGEAAVYAFQVLEKNKLEGKYDEKQELAQQSSTILRGIGGFMQNLVRKAKVVDDRYKFYQ